MLMKANSYPSWARQDQANLHYYIIGMLDEPTDGYHYFAGEPVHQLKEKQRSALYKKYIGFVFQAYHLIDELTVYENIETSLIYQNIKGSERRALVADAL